MGLTQRRDHKPGELSGGEQQRVAIARALAIDPQIMLFDEPTSALDPELTAEVTAVIAKLAQQDITMLIVTHEMEFARTVAGPASIFLRMGRSSPGARQKSFLKASRTTASNGSSAAFKNEAADLKYRRAGEKGIPAGRGVYGFSRCGGAEGLYRTTERAGAL